MSDITITYEQIDDCCFKFHFRGENFCTSMYMNNPFSVPKVKWEELRDAIEHDTYFTLKLTNDNEWSYIESNEGFVTFTRCPLGHKNISLEVAVKNETKSEKDEVLNVFDQLLSDDKNEALWK